MKIRNMTRAALFAALICVCAWISIPLPPVRYTLQTFGVALALLTLGGKWGSRAVGLYLLLGAAGLPVFSGFRGGLAALGDLTGGYLWGFYLGAWVYRLLKRRGFALWAFLGVQYLWGGLWFAWYAGSLKAALALGVAPYLIPDIIKLLLARQVAAILKRRLGP